MGGACCVEARRKDGEQVRKTTWKSEVVQLGKLESWKRDTTVLCRGGATGGARYHLVVVAVWPCVVLLAVVAVAVAVQVGRISNDCQ